MEVAIFLFHTFSKRLRKFMILCGIFMIFPGGLLIFRNYPNISMIDTLVHIFATAGLFYLGLNGGIKSIKINSTQITIDGAWPVKGVTLNWEEISSIRIGTSSISIYDRNQTKHDILYDSLKYETIQKLKSTISSYANRNSITITQ